MRRRRGAAPPRPPAFSSRRRTARSSCENGKYPLSADVSDTRPDELEIKRQTAGSVATSENLEAVDATIADLLRRRQTDEAANKITQADAAMRRLGALFPKSRRLDFALQEKFAYLAAHRAELAAIQRQVYDNVRPVAEA